MGRRVCALAARPAEKASSRKKIVLFILFSVKIIGLQK
jgi:hypothetical protein